MEIKLDIPEEFHLQGDFIAFKQDVSEEEFWDLANEDSNFELIDGVLVIHSPATPEHEDIGRYLSGFLSLFLEKTSQGKVYGSHVVMRLDSQWDPEPDLLVLLAENYDKIKQSRIEGPADIVIEVLSKSTKELDLTKKIPKYLEAGVKEIWIIDPILQSITIQWVDDSMEWTKIDSDDCLISKVIQDLPLQINWIWHREDYPLIELARIILKEE
jgi:Uma2 family endonuclease